MASLLRKWAYRIKRRFIAPAPAQTVEGGVHPDIPSYPRVLLLASNSVDNDTRVKKTAAALRANGYAVGILGVASKGAEPQYTDPGLHRAVMDKAFVRIYCGREMIALKRLERLRRQRKSEWSTAKRRLGDPDYHDWHLEGLSSTRLLSRKLWLIWRQKRKMQRLAALDEQQTHWEKWYAQRRAALKEQIVQKHARYAKFTAAAKHWNFYRTFRGSISKFRPDIIHANDLLTLPSAIMYKLRVDRTVKVIYDAHELEMHRNKTYDFIRNLADQVVEWWCIRKADHVITVSEGIADELVKSYGVKRPIVVLNSPSLGGLEKGPVLRRMIGLSESARIIAYVGVVTFGRGLDTLIKSLAFLPRDHHVVIIGPRRSDRDQPLLELASSLGIIDRVHLVHPVEPSQVPSVLSSADIAINPSIKVCLSYDLALPNKLFDAVFARVPSLVQELREMKAFVDSTRVGIARNMSTPEQTASAILETVDLIQKGYFSDTDWAGVAQQYCWEAQTTKLVGAYTDLMSRRSLSTRGANATEALEAA